LPGRVTPANRNLTVRIVSALVLLPGVLYLAWLGGVPFAVLIAVAAGLGAAEVNGLPWAPREQGAPPAPGRRLSVSLVASVAVAASFALVWIDQRPSALLWFPALLAALVIVALTDALFFELQIDRAPVRVGLAVLGAVWPGLLLSTLVPLRSFGFGWIILTLTVTWLNDTGGYFAGRFLGKSKMFPRISPKKTWAGFVGGLLASIAGAIIARELMMIPGLPVWGAAIIGAGAGLLGPLGDLSESMMKRAFGAKDSGRLLPGHGGMLDRIDALFFNSPWVLAWAWVFAG
jgi:phosphatidate cytidylyltransferase